MSHFIRVFLISAILPFLSGKVLTNVKMHVERKVFSKDKLLLQGHQVPSVNSAAGLALVFLLMYYFEDYIKFIMVSQKIHTNNS